MRILMSIKEQYADQIFDGTKSFEFRSRITKKKDVDTVVVYVCRPVKKIIGEFKIKNILKAEPQELWDLTHDRGIERELYDMYFADKSIGYAIEIGKIKKYKEPKTLKDFGLKTPPQSYQYLFD